MKRNQEERRQGVPPALFSLLPLRDTCHWLGGLHRCLNPASFIGLERRLQSTGSVKQTIVTILRRRERVGGGWDSEMEKWIL